MIGLPGRGARAVESGILLRCCTGNRTEGSNPSLSARNRNRILKPNRGRHEVPTQMYSPKKILNLKGFATLRMAQKVRFDL